jgi:hypothetical protein
MWIVEYKNPYTGNIEEKKFYGIYADGHAMTYAEKQYFNYHTQVQIRAYETKDGIRTGNGWNFGTDDKKDFIFTEDRKRSKSTNPKRKICKCK